MLRIVPCSWRCSISVRMVLLLLLLLLPIFILLDRRTLGVSHTSFYGVMLRVISFSFSVYLLLLVSQKLNYLHNKCITSLSFHQMLVEFQWQKVFLRISIPVSSLSQRVRKILAHPLPFTVTVPLSVMLWQEHLCFFQLLKVETFPKENREPVVIVFPLEALF